ncbi:MAG: flippase [Candidatus Micrarchaeota archaeon]
MAEISQHSKEVARGSFWSLVGSAFFKLVSFVYVVLIARAASQEDIGTFYLALSAMSLIWIFSDIGISGAFTRYVPYFEGKGERGKIRDLLSLSYRYLTLLSVIIMAVLFWQADNIGGIYGNARLPEAIRILSVYILLGNLFRLNYLYLQGIADIRGSQLYQNLQNLIKLVVTVLLFYAFGPSVMTISAGFVISVLLAFFASCLPVFRSVASMHGKAGLGKQELFSEIVPLGLTVAVVQYFSTIIASSDRLILGFMVEPSSSAAMVAVYSMATTLAAVLMVFPGSVGSIFLPLVSRLSGKNDLEGMREVMATAQRWSLFITLPVAAVMMAFSGDMLSVFYGSQYSGGAASMALFTLGLVIASFSFMASLALTAMRLVKIELFVAVACGIVNVALNLLLIPMYGMEGAAAASVASFILSTLLLTHYARKLIGFSNPPEAYKLLFSMAIVLLAVFFVKPLVSDAASAIIAQAGAGEYIPKAIYLAYLGLLIGLSGALFVAVSLALKCFREEDIGLMRKVLDRAGVPEPLCALAEKVASYGVHGEK